MEVDVLIRCTFNSFDKVHAAIVGCNAKTSTNLILGKNDKNIQTEMLHNDGHRGQLPNNKRIPNDLYKKLGYNVSRLDEVSRSGIASQKYWFYSPECAQLVSETSNVPVIVLAAENYSFIPLNQEPDF
ncbi:34535_t:CDS:2 [Gigaspora margarita]|uniref:34535_t:CDS:1 n=1 Tax=Gigaspora margarita TaxID=4874 RepID=A0ABN7UR01_GIGMA|nr:34535_t:CDS:2 [Gigaspora margarita]